MDVGARVIVRLVACERLEPRLALAGNFTAYVSGGTLVVRGDDRGAEISISQPAPGQLTVSGTGTTINRAVAPATVSGVTANLFIRLGRGSDHLTFDQANPIVIRGSVDIVGGGGGDRISSLASPAGALPVGGSLRIRNLSNRHDARETSPGYLATTREHLDVAGGDISVTARGLACGVGLSVVDVARNLRIGNQVARVTSVQVTGTNVGGDLAVTSGGTEATSCLVAGCVVRGSTTLVGGPGSDTVVANDVDFGGAVSILTGRGEDRLSVGAESISVVMVPAFELREMTHATGVGSPAPATNQMIGGVTLKVASLRDINASRKVVGRYQDLSVLPVPEQTLEATQACLPRRRS